MRISIASVWVVAGLLFLPTSTNLAMAAGDAAIRGVVTDGAGKPIRGAVVKAASGSKTVARYTGKDGRYEIPGLQAGRYTISVNAYGFGLERQTKDAAQGGETNFTLSPQNDVTRLTSAELEYLFPDTPEARMITGSCSGCHGFETVLLRRGMPAAAWEGYLRLCLTLR